MTGSDDALKVRPQLYILDLDDVAPLLASFSPRDLRDAMRAIRRLSEQLRSRIVYDRSEGVSFLNTSAEGRFEITYQATPDRFTVHDIEISRTPLTERSGAFVVRHGGKPRAIRIMGPPEGGYLCGASPAGREGEAPDFGFDDVEASPNRHSDGSDRDVPCDILVGSEHALTLGAEGHPIHLDSGYAATLVPAVLSLGTAGLGHGPRTPLRLDLPTLSTFLEPQVDATRPGLRSSSTGRFPHLSSIDALSIPESVRGNVEGSGSIGHSDALGPAETAFAPSRDNREVVFGAYTIAGLVMYAHSLGVLFGIAVLSGLRRRDRGPASRGASEVTSPVLRMGDGRGRAEEAEDVLSQLRGGFRLASSSVVLLVAVGLTAVPLAVAGWAATFARSVHCYRASVHRLRRELLRKVVVPAAWTVGFSHDAGRRLGAL